MKPTKLWLGSFEESLYENFTEEVKCNWGGKKKTHTRKCVRCDKLMRTTRYEFSCYKCQHITGARIERFDEND